MTTKALRNLFGMPVHRLGPIGLALAVALAAPGRSQSEPVIQWQHTYGGAAGVALNAVAIGDSMSESRPKLLGGTTAGCSPGADGVAASLSGIVNSYYPALTDAVAGATSIDLDALNGAGAATTLASGDQVLILQMQDAQIDASNTHSYGSGIAGEPASGTTALGSTGLFEFACVEDAVGAGGGTLTLATPLANTYRATGSSTFQVIRVPQYVSATLGNTLSAAAWDGESGGVVVIDVVETLDWEDWSVDVSGLGFRGGPSDVNALNFSVLDWVTADPARAAPKGEGIAGTPVGLGGGGYPNGDRARGAPGNGGGGGNGANGGGGGGANCGAGGQGGNSYQQSSLRSGGFGGAPLSSSPLRLALGGGGGSGEENNSSGSVGAAGGGIAMLYAGAVAGPGTVVAAGLDAASALNDGGGGGGGGGSILIAAASGLSGLTVTATGGDGADLSFPEHGPGGGGGGGVAITSQPAPSVTVAGGAEGGPAWGASPGLPGGEGTFASPPACRVGPPAFTKSFAPNIVCVDETTTLTFTIDNTQTPIAFTNLAFTDPFPAGLVVANPANASTTCTGGMITAMPGDPSLSYSGGSVPANGSCTIRVDVISSISGVLFNTTDILTSDQGRLGTAAARLNVALFKDGFESGDTSAWSVTVN